MFARVSEMNLHVEITPQARDFVAEQGCDIQFGARPLKRAIQKHIEDVLAEEIIKSNVSANDKVVIDFDEEKKETKSIVVKAQSDSQN